MLEKFLFVNDLDAVFDFQNYDLQKIHEELDSERNTWLKRYQLINLHSHFHVILRQFNLFSTSDIDRSDFYFFVHWINEECISGS